MRKLIAYGITGAIVGVIAAVVGNLLMPRQVYGDFVTAGGVDAAKLYALNKPYEIVGYLLLGSLLSSVIALLANSHRTSEVKTRSFFVGLVLGGPLCAGANALIKLICLSIAHGYSSNLVIDHAQSSFIHDVAFMLHYALIPTALALALTVAVGINGFTIQRGLYSALLASVISGITIHFLFMIIAPIMIIGAIGSGGIKDFDLSALLKPLLIAHLLGMGLGAALAFGFVQIMYRAAWLRGLNNWSEGRSLPIPSPVAVIGCGPGLNMPLPADGFIAPAHAQIDSTEDSHLIRPVMGEVRVNGSPTQEAWLNDSDVVELGSYRFQYRNRLSGATHPETPRPVAVPVAKPPDAAHLTIEDPMGGRHALSPGVTVLGRDSNADIALPWESTVSRRHAEIRLGGNGCTITDLGSSNGTFINGVAISTGALEEGDELRLGRCVLRVRRC